VRSYFHGSAYNSRCLLQAEGNGTEVDIAGVGVWGEVHIELYDPTGVDRHTSRWSVGSIRVDGDFIVKSPRSGLRVLLPWLAPFKSTTSLTWA
jgi:hypothetical protein